MPSEPTLDERLAAFEARIARGEKIEPGDWMPDAYRQQLIRMISQHAHSEVVGMLPEGDQAVAAQDVQALRRVAHNLKSVLTMLGEAPAAQCARSTEEWAAGGHSDLMQQGWRQLRQQVLRVVSVQGES